MTAPKPAPRPLLSVREAAEYLGCSRHHVYTLISEGGLRSFNIGTAKALTRIHPDDLDRFLENRARRGAA